MGAFLVAEVPVGGPSSDRCWGTEGAVWRRSMGWVGKKKSTAGQLAGTANELTKEVLERAVHRESPVIRPDVVVGIPAVDRRPKQ
ncbi:Uncharacterised protein [Mycobacterium tuberculosis]|nr:Uncharacterised protein [Mycobacterium tuberculosis]